MKRGARPLQSLAASPTMVGAVTTLIAIVAVFLAYNANNGLPFVPVYRVSVDVPNSARLVNNNEVRIGGHRVGVVESIEVPVGDRPAAAAAGEEAEEVARLNLKLDKTVEPLPRDSSFRVRYKSAFGLKYLEVGRGDGPLRVLPRPVRAIRVRGPVPERRRRSLNKSAGMLRFASAPGGFGRRRGGKSTRVHRDLVPSSSGIS